ncbi:MAG: hypothetical protein QW177_02355, partial [Candidatus Nitrosotenuis sp.]
MRNIKVLSISLIVALVLSSSIASYGDTLAKNYRHTTTPIFVEKAISPQLTKDFTISIDENRIQLRNQEVTVTLVKQPKIEFVNKINIIEDINVSNDDGSDNQLYLVKHNPTQAILERIFNSRKFKLDKIVSLLPSDVPLISLYHDLTGSLGHHTGDPLLDDFDEIQLNSITTPDNENHNELLQFQPISTSLSIQSAFDDLDDQLTITVGWFEQQSTTYIFVFAAAAFYVIVRSEDPKIRIQNHTRLLSFVCISLLISSVVINPLSISSSYYAHAETEGGDSNESMQPPNSTESVNADFDEIPLSDIMNSTPPLPENIFTNFTTNEPSHQNEITNPTNSTATTPTSPVHLIQSLIESLTLTGNTSAPTNSTATTPTSPVHLIQSLIESLTLTGNTSAPTNSTATTPTSINIPVIPNATKSWGSNSTVTDSL